MKLERKYKNVSVSSGTLDIDELVFNCFGFLKSLQLDSETGERLLAVEQRLAALFHPKGDSSRPDRKNVLFENLFVILEDISPRGCFFGIHPGDPGKFGFWDKSVKFNPN